MSTLYLDRAGISLRIDGNALAVYADGERCNAVPLKLLERVVIKGRHTTLEADVLLKLAEVGIAVMVIGARHAGRVAIVLGPRHNDAAIRLAQAQAVMNPEFCLAFSRTVVESKLRHQHRVLAKWLGARPDARKPIFDAEVALSAALESVQRPQANGVESLRGIEGAAARTYYHAMAAVLPPAAGFNGRNRRPPRDPVNVCLSLAYTLLHLDAVRSAHSAGLDPLLGFFHRPAFGRESLASDLIEPLRALADEWVWSQWRHGVLRVEHFTTNPEGCQMHKAGREHFYPAWELHATLSRRWLRRTCMHLARTLRNTGLPQLTAGEHDNW